METGTGKRFVSKGDYLRVQVRKLLLHLLGTGMLLCCLVCGLATFFCLIFSLNYLVESGHQETPSFLLPLGAACVLAIVTYLLGRKSDTIVDKALHIPQVTPLTRESAANMLALDSLVRASSEPLQAQEGVLLRAVAQGQETPPEQLVRASVGTE